MSKDSLIQKLKTKLDKAMEAFKGHADHPAFDYVEDAYEDILIYLSEPASPSEMLDNQALINKVAMEQCHPDCPICRNEPASCGSCLEDARVHVEVMRPYMSSPVRELGGE